MLWEQLCTYNYLPRLSKYSVLEDAIREGLPSGEFFAYAAGVDNCRYIDLKYQSVPGWIDKNGFLVKTSAAKKQLAEEEEARRAEEELQNGKNSGNQSIATEGAGGTDSTDTTGMGTGTDSKGGTSGTQPKNRPTTHFHLSTHIDYIRINKIVPQIVEEIIQHIQATEGIELSINLEVTANTDKGFSQETMSTVIINGDALKIDHLEFDK